jgi:hypothetical protein
MDAAIACLSGKVKSKQKMQNMQGSSDQKKSFKVPLVHDLLMLTQLFRTETSMEIISAQEWSHLP